MTEIHQTLKFNDLPSGTQFFHPKTNIEYIRLVGPKPYNAHAVDKKALPYYTTIHPTVIVTLTSSIDFFSLPYSAIFAYDQKVYIKVARNRARVVNNSEIIKYFEPNDSVSPL